MREEFKRIAFELAGTRGQTNPSLPPELASSFVLSGLFEILARWLRQPDDFHIGNEIVIIDTLIVRSTARPVGVRLL